MSTAWALTQDSPRCPAGRIAPACGAREHTADLHATVQRLRSFNRSVSHDLRGPLGAMGGVTRLAIEAIARSDTSRAIHLLSATARHADTLASLVGELLALAEGDEFDEEIVDLNEIVQDALAQLGWTQAVDRSKMPSIHVAHLPITQGSRGLLRQVFVNLIGNALKFTRDIAAPRIDVGCEQIDGENTIFVRDNGVGFDPGESSALFEPFQRLHGSRFPGTGVGLSMVKRIVERHDGRVWADSKPGAGATFHFTIRAIQEVPAGDI
jgi:signal transduction histidine kinase